MLNIDYPDTDGNDDYGITKISSPGQRKHKVQSVTSAVTCEVNPGGDPVQQSTLNFVERDQSGVNLMRVEHPDLYMSDAAPLEMVESQDTTLSQPSPRSTDSAEASMPIIAELRLKKSPPVQQRNKNVLSMPFVPPIQIKSFVRVEGKIPSNLQTNHAESAAESKEAKAAGGQSTYQMQET